MAQHSRSVFYAGPYFRRVFCAGRRERSFALRKLIACKVPGVISLVLLMIAAPTLGQDLPVCQDPRNAISISQSNLAPANVDIHMEQDSSNSKTALGVLHFYLRSDTSIEPQKICATSHFADTRDEPQTVSVTLDSGASGTSQKEDQNTSCVVFAVPWKTFQEMPLDLHMNADSNLIPLAGLISLSASGQSKEPVLPDAAKKQSNQGQSSAGRQDSIPTHVCTTTSKALTRSVVLLPSITPSSFKIPLIIGVGVAVLYFLISMAILWQKKGLPMGGPQWSFTTSFATNFTVGTGLLTPLLGAGVLTDALHYMTRFHYVVLGISFAALLLLGPAFVSLFSTKSEATNESGQTSTAPVGTVGLFLATSALMIGAAVGQLLTVGFTIAEVEFRGYIDCTALIVMLMLLVCAGTGTIACAVITIRFYLKEDPVQARRSIVHLQSFGQKIAGLRSGVERYAVASELFTDRDGDAVARAIERHKPGLRTWNMF